MVRNYLKTAWRSIWFNKRTSLLNITGLAVAMAAGMLILLWVQNETRYDRYHPDAERIYLLTEYDTERAVYTMESSPFLAAAAIKSSIPEVGMVAMAQQAAFYPPLLTINGQSFKEKNALYVDTGWLRMFQYEILTGSIETFIHNPQSLLISVSKAKQYFGSRSPLEQVIHIDGVAYSIAGVIKDPPAYSSFGQDVLVPVTAHPNYSDYTNTGHWGQYSQSLFIKLSDQAVATSVEKKISGIYAANQPWRKDNIRQNRLIPLSDLHFKQELNSRFIKHGNPQNIQIFSILAALLLITACINFINLSIARIGLRLKEIGIRKIVGAAKVQLFVQVMIETAIAVLLAMGIALLIATITLPFFNSFTERNFVLDPGDGTLSFLLGGIFVFVLLLTGIYPALLLAALRPLGLLKNTGLAGLSRIGLRKALVVVQLTLAVCMIIGVIVTHNQFAFIQQQVAGYQKEQIFKIKAPPSKEIIRVSDRAAMQRHTDMLMGLKNDLLQSSAVIQVSKVNGVSIINDNRANPSDIEWVGYPPLEEQPAVVEIWLDEDYLEVANLKIKTGRWFDPANTSDKHNLVLNETAIKAFGLKEPVVGTTFAGGIYQGGTVIGVVEDFHHKSLHNKIDPVILAMDPFGGHVYLVKAHAGQVSKALEDAEAVWKARYPGEMFEYVFLDEEFDTLYKDDKKALTFSLLIGGLSILIACLGLLGMVMISTRVRVKEIGIRKVLGASVTGIVTLLTKDFVKLVCLAIVIAIPVAWWAMNKWLEDYAYRIEIQWWVFAGAGILAIVIVLFTVSWQAIRAAIANPVESLRDE